MKKCFWIIILLLLMCCIGCGKKDEADQQIVEPIEYYVIAEQLISKAPSVFSDALEEDIIFQRDIFQYKGTLYQESYLVDSDYNWKEGYLQTLSDPYIKWEENAPMSAIDLPIENGHLQDFYGVEGFGLCARMYDHDNKCSYLVRFDQGKVEVIGEVLPKELDENYKIELDSQGRAYAYSTLSSSTWYRLDDKLQILNQTREDAFIKGVVFNGQEVLWYGGNHKGACIKNGLNNTALFQEEKEMQYDTMVMRQAPMEGQDIYYIVDNRGLWRYEKGLEKLFDFIDRDYVINDIYGMEISEDGSIQMTVKVDGLLTMLNIHLDPEYIMPQKQEIVLADFWMHDRVKASIARFNRQSDQYHITIMDKAYETDWDEIQDYRKRLQMELTAGGGPDILSSSIMLDIALYVEKGYLEDLSDVIKEENYLKAPLDYGRYQGGLYEAPYQCNIRTLAYSRDLVGDRTEITLKELMQLVEESGIKVLVHRWNELDIILMMAFMDQSNKTYIDLEKGISHLNEQPFKDLVQFAQKYADDGSQDLPTLIKSGSVGSVEVDINDPQWMEYAYACFPDCGAAYLGFPREDGKGTYLTNSSFVVNANSKCKEGAKEFIKFLMSEDMQKRNVDYANSQREDGAMPVSIKALDYLVEKAQMKIKGEHYLMFNDVKFKAIPLNDEQVEQYYRLIDHSTTIGNYPPYCNIIDEELPAYLNGDKSLDEVTQIIHKRVQLYLDEQR